MMRTVRISGLVAALCVLGACTDTMPTSADPAVDPVASRTPAKGPSSIGQIAVAAATNADPAQREFTQLVAALQFVDAEEGTKLVELFADGRDQYTVFAPTDAAFSGLYALASSLLQTPISRVDQLPSAIVRDVLLYHVTEGRRAANSVVPRNGHRTIGTLKGETFAVTSGLSIRDGLTPIDPDPRPDARIVTPNLSASNGIVHVIDQVILPPSTVRTLLALAGAR